MKNCFVEKLITFWWYRIKLIRIQNYKRMIKEGIREADEGRTRRKNIRLTANKIFIIPNLIYIESERKYSSLRWFLREGDWFMRRNINDRALVSSLHWLGRFWRLHGNFKNSFLQETVFGEFTFRVHVRRLSLLVFRKTQKTQSLWISCVFLFSQTIRKTLKTNTFFITERIKEFIFHSVRWSFWI